MAESQLVGKKALKLKPNSIALQEVSEKMIKEKVMEQLAA